MILLFTASSAFAADQRPVVLAFELASSESVKRAVVSEATQAVKFYLRESGRADVISFDVESSLIKRAVREGRVKPESLVNVTALEDQLALARALEASAVLCGEVDYNSDKVTIKVTLAEVGSKHKWQHEGYASASGLGIQVNEQSISNAIQSAASFAIAQLSAEALKNVVPVTGSQTDPSEQLISENVPQDAETCAKEADKQLEAGNLAGAIDSYRKAVNADPQNINYRRTLQNTATPAAGQPFLLCGH